MEPIGEKLEGTERNLYHAYRRRGEVGEWDDSALFCGAGLPLAVMMREINESSRS